MAYWICVMEKDCKKSFDSVGKLKTHQQRCHDAEPGCYRYAHCTRQGSEREDATFQVRLLENGECNGVHQIKLKSHIYLADEVHRRVHFKDHPVLAAYRAKLEQIKILVNELNNFYV